MLAAIADYEQVLVVGPQHPLRNSSHVKPEQLSGEILITYPITIDRLDIYTRFLTPAGISPKRHKLIETTDILSTHFKSRSTLTASVNFLHL